MDFSPLDEEQSLCYLSTANAVSVNGKVITQNRDAPSISPPALNKLAQTTEQKADICDRVPKIWLQKSRPIWLTDQSHSTPRIEERESFPLF